MRLGLKLVLNAMTAIKVVGEAENGLTAIEKTSELQPDLVLLDIGLPDLSGLEALPAIRQQCPKTRILMLTSHDDLVISAIDGGADGLCKKNVSNEQLYLAIQSVLAGEKWFDTTEA